MEKNHITIGEAAKMLGVSVDTLRRWDKKGILKPLRASEKAYRYYLKSDLFLFWNNLYALAEEWVKRELGVDPDPKLYCTTSDVFQSRLVRLQNELAKIADMNTPFSLIVALVGEIGNNSFDHNLGNWRDVPGIFFAYDLKKRTIVLADRGQGLLKTLQRVRPDLQTHAEAMQIAFTEIVSGRAPESRGNGLKFVKKIVVSNPLSLLFTSGNAKLALHETNQALNISEKIPHINGCIAFIQF